MSSRRSQSAKHCQEQGDAAKCVSGSSQRVMYIKDSLLSTARELQIVKLKHPRQGTAAMYVYDVEDQKLYDLITFDEEHRSWFVGETVQSDGKLYIVSPIDVSYLILPYLMKASKNVPLDHLLRDPDISAMSCLAAASAGKDFSHIADRKGNPELEVWKYNEEKTLQWLEKRTQQLSEVLMEKKVPTSTSQSFTFVRTMDLDQTREAYMILSHGIISEYLPENLGKALFKHLKLPEVKNKAKIARGEENQPPNKKQKAEQPSEDYTVNAVSAKKVNAPQTAKAKALAKSASGSKSITSFFTKK